MGSFIYSNVKYAIFRYVCKSETAFDLPLNNHRKDIQVKNEILACKHFHDPSHNFQRDAKLTLAEKNNETSYNRIVTTYSKKRERLDTQAKSLKNLMMPKRRNSRIFIFCSEYCTLKLLKTPS